MKLKRFIRDYLTFSRKERNASIAILLLIGISILAPSIDRYFQKENVHEDYTALSSMFTPLIEDEQKFDEHPVAGKRGNFSYSSGSSKDTEPDRNLFAFDPNVIGVDDWIALGVKKHIAERAIKFRTNGGSFNAAEDLLKVYGFDEKDYLALKDYVLIPSTKENETGQESSVSFRLANSPEIIEINSATTSDLIQLGFSENTSNRILNFVNSLGGIYSISQLEKVYGVNPDDLISAAEFIQIDPSVIKKININACDSIQLAAHGYISDELAKSIIDYRNLHGRFVSVSEISKVKGMYRTLFEKLEPYLTL